jgi:hypothetical protein
VFDCYTSAGNLVTQGYGWDSKLVITLLSRDRNSRIVADLTSYATNLCGIVCKNESIYIVEYPSQARGNGFSMGYFIIKLSMTRDVKGVYKSEKEQEFINKIISLNGQIIALCTSDAAIIPLKDEMISSE